jgi:manganese/zinc/iron transport system permease protein
MMLDFWTITVGILVNVPCAVVGCYLVLRRMSLLGDAISHAVLPGIALAFLLSRQVHGAPILIGAMVLGVLTTFLTQALHELGRVPEDSSMGIVYTSLFAAGVLLMQNAAPQVDLDPGCVLYGAIEHVAADTVSLGGWEVPRALQTLAPVLLFTLGFVLLFWKELKITSFDPELATALGINATLMHYLLMALTAGVTVAAFEVVGSVLVVAMLIVPAATAHLLTDRLDWMVVWAVVVAMLAAVLGAAGSLWLNVTGAAMMAVAVGLLFGLAVLLAPRHGVLSKLLRNGKLALRIACEDVLGTLYRREEAAGRGQEPPPRRLPGGLLGWLAAPLLVWQGLVRREAGGNLRLTPQGKERAAALVRGHRLWEAYLQEHLGLPLDHLHEPAERMEHFLDPQLQNELAAQVHRTDVDPHGKTIPPPVS